MEDAYRQLFSKKQLTEKHRDNSQLPKQPLSELQGETMKNRYVAVLKGNKNYENSHHDNYEIEAPVKKNSQDFEPVEYTIMKPSQIPDIKPLAIMDECLPEEDNNVATYNSH